MLLLTKSGRGAMRENREAMMVVRAELCERLEALRGLSARASADDFARSAARIRELAAAYGLAPVARLAEALQGAAARERPGSCRLGLYMERLQDAIGCERVDEEASRAMLASVSVRLGA
jgi:hypothetical protein